MELARRLGTELSRSHRLETADDVFWLDFDELAAVVSGQLAAASLVAERRAAFARNSATRGNRPPSPLATAVSASAAVRDAATARNTTGRCSRIAR